ncbi:hypothetical protein KJ359_013320 [Pestalotiopsis sp. 9143b]|nr:hypothetical protein KJ359_013320 [Pestalotiopsis sp. 9143b]
MSGTTTTITSNSPISNAQIKELSPGFGAEYGVVMLRDTNLTDETHLELARQFGELDDMTPYIKAGRKSRLRYDQLFDVSNLEPDGRVFESGSPHAHFNKGNGIFHVDSSFNPRRAGYSLLLAHELPPAGSGGSTEFCDTRAAWDGLDDDTRAFLLERDFVACHSIVHSRKMAAPEYFADMDPADHFMSRHKLVQRHERSGRMNLYLAMHIHHIEGLEAQDSDRLFWKLFDHATQEKYRVTVDWHSPGDMVIWDNTCTMHRALGGDFAYKYRRDMRRATVHDDSSQAWGLNEHSDDRQGLP